MPTKPTPERSVNPIFNVSEQVHAVFSGANQWVSIRHSIINTSTKVRKNPVLSLQK